MIANPVSTAVHCLRLSCLPVFRSYNLIFPTGTAWWGQNLLFLLRYTWLLFHLGFGNTAVGQQPIVRWFVKRGSSISHAISKLSMSTWDLAMVLKVILQPSFKHLDQFHLKVLSLNMAMLMVLTSAKHVSDIQKFSVNSFMQFLWLSAQILLKPNSSFTLKDIDTSLTYPPITLWAFISPFVRL